jgi:hypothetical protein
MLGRKLVVIAAAVALAMTHVAEAKHNGKVSLRHQKHHVKVSVHKYADANATEEVIEFCQPG